MEQKPLIVSYSYSGNTHRIAAELRRLTGGDKWALYPSQPYPMAYDPLLVQVQREVRSHYYPHLLPVPLRVEDYEVIFVGSPVWCGTIAPPLASWLVKNNLAGKLVAPFYSHCGGAVSTLERDIQALCPQASVAPALPVVNAGGDHLEATLTAWLSELGARQGNISAKKA